MTWTPYTPWTVDKSSASATVRDNAGAAIARCYRGDVDAQKVAAIPDMLNALHQAGDVIEAHLVHGEVSEAGWNDILDFIAHTILKAEGK